MTRKLSRFTVAIAVFVALTSLSAVAFAAWSVSSGGGGGGSGAGSVPAGGTPAASVSNRDVTVTWPQVTLPGGAPADGYRVTRYDSGGATQTITSNCTGVITGLSCTEVAVPPGQWRYAVAPKYSSWDGPNGPQSSAVTVNAPAVSLNPTTITQFPAQITATISNYLPNQSVSIRLDGAGGTELGTLTSGAGGGGSTNVSIPNTVADGPHSLHAVGAGGDTSNAPFTVNAPIPVPSSVLLKNNGGGAGAGRPAQGDTVEITFSGNLAVASLCSTWSGDTTDKSITGNDQVYAGIDNNVGASGNDVFGIQVYGACGDAFKLGTIDLGTSGFVTGLTAWGGSGGDKSTITYSVSQRKLTILLGRRVMGANPAKITTSLTATYTPDASIMGVNGRAISGTVSSTGVQF